MYLFSYTVCLVLYLSNKFLHTEILYYVLSLSKPHFLWMCYNLWITMNMLHIF